MKVWGVDHTDLRSIARDLGLVVYNGRPEGRAYAFRLVPSGLKYQRKGQQLYTRKDGTTYRKRIKAVCYHGFRDFIKTTFDRGATRVQSTWGDWSGLTEFERDLSELAHRNVGSMVEPVEMIELCECEGI